MKRVILLTVLVLLISSGYLFSDVPCKINYQGRLIKDNVPVHNPTGVPMTFTVDGIPVYTGNVPVYNGLFRVVLDLENIDWAAGEEKSLEVTVEGELLTPPEPIYAYPYAINSHLLEGKTTAHFLDVSGSTQTKQGGLNIKGDLGVGGYIGLGPRIYPGLLGTESGYSMVHFKNIEADKAGAIRASQGTGDDPDAPLRYEGSKHTFNTTNYNTRMVILDNGNIGIGTTSPGAKLEVSGEALFAPTSQPTSPLPGMIYYDQTDDTMYYYSGATMDWVPMGGESFGVWTTIDSDSNTIVRRRKYKVTSDGYLFAKDAADGHIGLKIFDIDGSTVLLTYYGNQHGAGHLGAIPITKDSYFEVDPDGYVGDADVIYWLPIGGGQCVPPQ